MQFGFEQAMQYSVAIKGASVTHKVKIVSDMQIEIQNTQECFVALWQKLERTRQLFGMQFAP